jgi:hypothetical protein
MALLLYTEGGMQHGITSVHGRWKGRVIKEEVLSETLGEECYRTCFAMKAEAEE